MEVKVGRYTVKSDPYCMWITETRKNAHAGVREIKNEEVESIVAGYVNTIDQLYEDFCDRKFRNSDAQSVKDFLSEAVSIKKDIVKVCKAMRKFEKSRYEGEE